MTSLKKEWQLGLWAYCVPHGASQEVVEALLKQGIQCDVGTSAAVSSELEVVCSKGEAMVHLLIGPMRVTLVSTKLRASVEHALIVKAGHTSPRNWRQRRLDGHLLSRIKAVLEPLIDAEHEIEKAALLAKATDAAEADEVLREWNRKYRKGN